MSSAGSPWNPGPTSSPTGWASSEPRPTSGWPGPIASTDVYVLFQPYTFQDNTPYGLKSAVSYALGVTVPLPVYNRNQGGIQRAVLNVTQTQTELAETERQARSTSRRRSRNTTCHASRGG